MEDRRRKLIEVNVAWKVMKVCFQHNLTSPTITEEIKRRVVEDIYRTMSSQNLGFAELHRVCDERLATLDLELQYPDGLVAKPAQATTP